MKGRDGEWRSSGDAGVAPERLLIATPTAPTPVLRGVGEQERRARTGGAQSIGVGVGEHGVAARQVR